MPFSIQQVPVGPVEAVRSLALAEAAGRVVTPLVADLADRSAHAATTHVDDVQARAQQHVQSADLGFSGGDTVRREDAWLCLYDERDLVG